jgi:hypothetical protein
MSTLTHKHRVNPIEIYEHFARRFNGVVGSHIINVTFSNIQFKLSRHPNDDKNIIITLFSKLVESFQSIRKKYLYHLINENLIRLKIKETDNNFVILLYGSVFIPPAKIFNLFNLILWYYIRYKSGLKPNRSNYGRTLTGKWKQEEKLIKRELNHSPKILLTINIEEPCYFCGELSQSLNRWTFKLKRSFTPINLETIVCNEHINQVF